MGIDYKELRMTGNFLKKPTKLTDQNWPDDSIPLVSISCITYNHENYIRDAIEGFINQKTTFQVEILIHDDASDDKTADIINEYEDKYPKLIKPIYQTVNRYSQGKRVGSFNRKRAVGTYIAMCEGDDFWTDPLKLEKQVKILEARPEFSMCMTSVKRIYEDKNESPAIIRPSDSDRIYHLKDMLSGNPVHTASVVFRSNKIPEIPEDLKCTFNFDYILWVHLARTGPVYYLNDVTAVYRIHSGGIYSSLDTIDQIKTSLKTRYAILENTEDDLKKYLYRNIFSLNNRLIGLYIKNNDFKSVSDYAGENLMLLKYLEDTNIFTKLSLYLKSRYTNTVFRNLYNTLKYIQR